jgi:hypothetical protein
MANPYGLNPYQIARASAALPAAGAYDATPTELVCAGFDFVTLYIVYTRGGAGGDMQFKIEVSPASGGDEWHQLTAYAKATVTSGSDLTSNAQREEVEYGSTGSGAEKFAYGPIPLNGTVERIRIPCQESGAVGTPGTCQIKALFS